MTYSRAKVQGQSVLKIELKQTDGRMDGGDCIIRGINAVGNKRKCSNADAVVHWQQQTLKLTLLGVPPSTLQPLTFDHVLQSQKSYGHDPYISSKVIQFKHSERDRWTHDVRTEMTAF